MRGRIKNRRSPAVELNRLDETVEDVFNPVPLFQVRSSRFSARGAHRIGVSSAMQADRIESAPVSRALRMSVKACGAGTSKPRSIREIELEAIFVIFAGCCWVMPPPCWRMVRSPKRIMAREMLLL